MERHILRDVKREKYIKDIYEKTYRERYTMRDIRRKKYGITFTK